MEKLTLITTKPAGKKKAIQSRQMTLAEAQALLTYEKARGFNEWTLPKDSLYQVDTNGNLIKRAGLATDKGAEASKGNSEGKGETDPA